MEVSKLVEFASVLWRYVIMKDLHQDPFMYPVVRDLFNQILEANPCAFYRFVSALFETKDHIAKEGSSPD